MYNRGVPTDLPLDAPDPQSLRPRPAAVDGLPSPPALQLEGAAPPPSATAADGATEAAPAADEPAAPVAPRILGRADHARLMPRMPLYFDLDVGEAEPLVLDRFALQERLYSGALTGRERLRPRGSVAAWISLGDHEVATGLGLRGASGAVDPKLVGWRRDPSAAAPDAIPASVRQAPSLTSVARVAEPVADENPMPTWLVAALIAVLLGLIAIVALLLLRA